MREQAAMLAAFLLLLLVVVWPGWPEPRPAAQAQEPTPTLEVVVNEVAWAGTGASSADEWLELYNPNPFPVDLSGWHLEAADGTPSIALQGTIAPGGFFLLERTDDTTVQDIPADCVYTGSLVNSGESLALKDPTGTVIDTANGDGGPWPAGTASSGSPPYASMERLDPRAPDTDANWCTNDGVTRNGLDAGGQPLNGTPKARNSCGNSPPMADAGPDRTVSVGDPVQLDGTNSNDPDGDPLTFQWAFASKPVGSQAQLSGASSPTPTFTPDVEGDYVLELTVSDGRGGTDRDAATITAVDRDLNRDGRVNVIDARICLQAALGLRALPADDRRRCDVDNDGTVEEGDARKIAERSLGLRSRLAQAGGLAASGLAAAVVLALGLIGSPSGRARASEHARWPHTVARRMALIIASLTTSALLGGCLGVPAGPFPPKGTAGLIADLRANGILLRVQNMPNGGLAALEVRAGGLTFDPAIIAIAEIQPAPGWRLLAQRLDNAAGEVRFAVVNPDPASGTVTGTVLTLTVQRKAQGDPKLRWDKAKLTLGDAHDREITSYQTSP